MACVVLCAYRRAYALDCAAAAAAAASGPAAGEV